MTKKPQKIDKSWTERFCRECAYFDKTRRVGAYYQCLWNGKSTHDNIKACEDFLNKNVVQKEEEQCDDWTPKEKKMEEKPAKLIKKNCYGVRLERYPHSFSDSGKTGLLSSGTLTESVDGKCGSIYVFADSFEEVGRRFPAAVNIELLGFGYVIEEDDAKA